MQRQLITEEAERGTQKQIAPPRRNSRGHLEPLEKKQSLARGWFMKRKKYVETPLGGPLMLCLDLGFRFSIVHNKDDSYKDNYTILIIFVIL